MQFPSKKVAGRFQREFDLGTRITLLTVPVLYYEYLLENILKIFGNLLLLFYCRCDFENVGFIVGCSPLEPTMKRSGSKSRHHKDPVLYTTSTRVCNLKQEIERKDHFLSLRHSSHPIHIKSRSRSRNLTNTTIPLKCVYVYVFPTTIEI